MDFTVDPPPDLAIEIERSRSAIPKLPVYSSFKVPEIWRFNGKTITVMILNSDGTYDPAPSRIFPGVPLEPLVEFIDRNNIVDQTTLLGEIQTWAATLAIQLKTS